MVVALKEKDSEVETEKTKEEIRNILQAKGINKKCIKFMQPVSDAPYDILLTSTYVK
jgi:hypothetical protein